MNIYELTESYNNLLELLYDNTMDEEMIRAALSQIEDAIEEKADGYAKIIANLERDIKGYKEEIERMQKNKASLENRVKQLKENLKLSMELTGKTKFKTQLFSFNIAKNGGKRSLILDVDIDQLPEQYVRIIKEADNEAIRQAIADGECAFAHLAEQGTHLTIK